MSAAKRQPAPIRIPVLLARLQAHALGKGKPLTPSIEILLRECREDGQAQARTKEGERCEIPIVIEPYRVEIQAHDSSGL